MSRKRNSLAVSVERFSGLELFKRVSAGGFFESTQEKKKRKSRDAARRNRKRRPQPKALLGDTQETLKDEGYKSDEDKWDLIDVESPYT